MDLHKKTYFLITGASRGIGQTMALRVAQKLKAGSVLILLARSQEGLDETKRSIEALDKALQVRTVVVDLSKSTEQQFAEILADSLGTEQAADFERAFIVHNAGTVGDVSKHARDVANTANWTSYFHMNLFSAVALNCEFMKRFSAVPKLIVNISSKCGLEPFASMSYYCAGKAARDMYFKVLAVEEEQNSDSNTLILNYAPGCIDTDMTVMVQQQSVNKQLADSFAKLRATETMLTTEQTCEKFLEVLEEQKFQSGDHVDYWD